MKYLMVFLAFSLVLAGNLAFAQSNDYAVGKVQFPDRCYSSVGSGTVIIIDPDMNKDPTQSESIPIQLWSSADTDIRTPNAIETGKDTGIFEAKVFFNMYDEAFSQRIRVFEGDTLHARYVDKTVPLGTEQTIETFVVMGTLPPDQKWGKNWETLSAQYNSTYVYDTCMAEFVDRLTHKQSLENLDVVYPSPLKQMENGLHANEILCKESLVLVPKYDGSPACVKPETKQKLIDRGWAETRDIQIQSPVSVRAPPDPMSITINGNNTPLVIPIRAGETKVIDILLDPKIPIVSSTVDVESYFGSAGKCNDIDTDSYCPGRGIDMHLSDTLITSQKEITLTIMIPDNMASGMYSYRINTDTVFESPVYDELRTVGKSIQFDIVVENEN